MGRLVKIDAHVRLSNLYYSPSYKKGRFRMGGLAKIEVGTKALCHPSEIHVSGLIKKSDFAWEV